jgi:hypothetical protein
MRAASPSEVIHVRLKGAVVALFTLALRRFLFANVGQGAAIRTPGIGSHACRRLRDLGRFTAVDRENEICGFRPPATGKPDWIPRATSEPTDPPPRQHLLGACGCIDENQFDVMAVLPKLAETATTTERPSGDICGSDNLSILPSAQDRIARRQGRR